jgi:hypothetical protein
MLIETGEGSKAGKSTNYVSPYQQLLMEELGRKSFISFHLFSFLFKSVSMQAAAADEQQRANVAAQRREIAATMLAEPDSNCQEPVLRGMFQMPDGKRLQHRFLLTSTVGDVFNFVESIEAGGFMPGSYRIVTRYPRRVLEASSSNTLSEAGFGPGQEVFVLEAVGAMQ